MASVSYSDASNADVLDPALLVTSFQCFAGGLLFDNLAAVNQRNEPVPALATHWESTPDAKTWTFELRQGVEFHDGRPFTSKDAAFTVRRVLDPKLGSAATALFEPYLKPSGVKTPAPNVLKLECSQPCAFMPTLLSTYFMRVLPDETSPAETSKGIGTGPFRLRSFKPGVALQVDRNPHYWISGRPYLDGVNVSIIYEPATKLQSVVSGEADVCDAIEFSQVPTIEGNSAVQTLVAPGAGFNVFVLYQKVAPFEDLRIRQAFKYVIDRRQLVDQVFFGHAAVSADISIPPQDPYYPHSVEPFPYDPEKAASLLAAAGYDGGLDVQMLTSNVSPGNVEAAVALQQMAKEGGINIDLKTLPTGTYYTQVEEKPLWSDFWLRQSVGYSLPLLYGENSPPGFNESGFSSPIVNDAIKRMQATLDRDKQKQAVADAYSVINETSGELIPCHADRVWLAKTGIQGVELNYSKVASMTDAFLS